MTHVADSEELGNEKGTDGRWLVVGLAGALAAVAAYFLLGMPGMDHSASSMGGSMPTMDGGAMAIEYNEFARRAALPGTVLINVHDSDDILIEGTDLSIPYDRLGGDDRLPADRSTEILLYCKTGRMSEQAATTLMRSGYRTVFQLRGGTDSLQSAG